VEVGGTQQLAPEPAESVHKHSRHRPVFGLALKGTPIRRRLDAAMSKQQRQARTRSLEGRRGRVLPKANPAGIPHRE